jgi:hypothetical protein
LASLFAPERFGDDKNVAPPYSYVSQNVFGQLAQCPAGAAHKHCPADQADQRMPNTRAVQGSLREVITSVDHGTGHAARVVASVRRS